MCGRSFFWNAELVYTPSIYITLFRHVMRAYDILACIASKAWRARKKFRLVGHTKIVRKIRDERRAH